jgi:hypothetical protein
LKIAPWWGDAYYNLAVSQELAGQFDPAQESLRLYILTNPGEREAREAQDRIYSLNAKKRLAATAQNTPQTQNVPTIEGVWRSTTPSGGFDNPAYETITIRRTGTGYSITSRIEPTNIYAQRVLTLVSATETMLTARHEMGFVPEPINQRIHQECAFRLTNSGQTLEETCRQFGNETMYRLTNSRSYARTQ